MTDFLGRGIVSPFRRDGSTDFRIATGFELVKSAVREVLGTVGDSPQTAGELPWDTEFGSRLTLLRHKTNNEELLGLVQIFVIEAIQRHEPRADITRVDVDQDVENNRLTVVVFIRPIQENVPANQVLIQAEPVEVTI